MFRSHADVPEGGKKNESLTCNKVFLFRVDQSAGFVASAADSKVELFVPKAQKTDLY